MYFPPINNPDQITKDPTLRAIKPWWVILVGAAILYLVPAQAVLEMPVVGPAVNGLASLIPSIARWVELSPFPYNTKLFAVFVWVMVPVQTYWLWSSKVAYQAFSVRAKASKLSSSRMLIDLLRGLVVLIPFVILGYIFALVDTPPCSICVNTVGWAQLFIGCVYALTISALIATCAWYSVLLFKSFTSKGNTHD